MQLEVEGDGKDHTPFTSNIDLFRLQRNRNS
jgi:hypothetical protein